MCSEPSGIYGFGWEVTPCAIGIAPPSLSSRDYSCYDVPLTPGQTDTGSFNVSYSGFPAQPGVDLFSWVFADPDWNTVGAGIGNPVQLSAGRRGTYHLGVAFQYKPAVVHLGAWGDYEIRQNNFYFPDITSGFGFEATPSTGTYTSMDWPYFDPALGDTLTFNWHSYLLNPVKSMVIMRENAGGDIHPTNTTRTFTRAGEVELGPGQYNPTGGINRDSWYTGAAVWAPGTSVTPGLCYFGLRFEDEHIELCGLSDGPNTAVIVDHTVTNVYTDAPFYAGREEQGHTNVHYTLNGPADSCTIYVGNDTTITKAPGQAGDNVYEWDGKTDSGDFCKPGVEDIYVHPKNCWGLSAPLWLQLSYPVRITPSGSQGSSFFIPDDGDKLSLGYTVSEQVKRPQATAAYVYASIYDDETGQIVKVLADGTACGVDNKVVPPPPANSPLVWDGTDESGQATVLPGKYTIAVMAKDNAGVGCESALQTVDVEVQMSDKPDESLNLGQDQNDQTHITGWTQLRGSVNWSDSAGGSGTAPVSATGDFDFTISDDPGEHTITATITRPDSTTHTETLDVFIADLDSTSPPSDLLPDTDDDSGDTSMMSRSASSLSQQSSFNPDTGGSASVTFTAQVPAGGHDYYDVSILDVFDAPQCISKDNPVPACTLLNGSLSAPKMVRTIWMNQQVGSTPVTAPWDGKGDNGGTLPAGPYVMQIKRTNADGLKYLSFCTDILVDATGTAPPVISDIQEQVKGTTGVIAWKTDVATTGAVLYADASGAVGRAASSAGTFHVAYLTLQPDTAYSYWVVAQGTSGNSASSAKRTFTSGAGETFEDASVSVVTATTATVSWTTTAAAYGRIQYAVVDPATSPVNLQWLAATEQFSSSQHSISLTGLQPNAEYVYRLSSCTNPAFVGADTSCYQAFVTKLTNPQVEISSPEEGEVVSGTTTVVVNASDLIHRFADATDNGIASVEFEIDGTPVGVTSHTPGSDEYDFAVDESLLGEGFHELRASATDEFWKSAQYVATVWSRSEITNQIAKSDSVLAAEEATPTTDKLKLRRQAVVAAGQPAVPTGKKLTMILVGTNLKMLDPKVTQNALAWEQYNYETLKYRCLTYDGNSFKDADAFFKAFFRLFECGRLKSFTYIGHADPGSLSPSDDGPNTWDIKADDLYDAHRIHHQQHPNGASRRLNNLRLFACHSRLPHQFLDATTRQKTDAYLDRYCAGCGNADSTAHVDALAVNACRVALHSITYKTYLWPIHMYYAVRGHRPR